MECENKAEYQKIHRTCNNCKYYCHNTGDFKYGGYCNFNKSVWYGEYRNRSNGCDIMKKIPDATDAEIDMVKPKKYKLINMWRLTTIAIICALILTKDPICLCGFIFQTLVEVSRFVFEEVEKIRKDWDK